MKYLILLLSILGPPLWMSAQALNTSQQAFLDSVAQQYVQATSYRMEVRMQAFDVEGQPIGVANSYRAFKRGDHYLVETPVALQLTTRTQQLLINHQAQLVTLQDMKEAQRSENIQEQLVLPFSKRNLLPDGFIWEETATTICVQLPATEGAQTVKYYFGRNDYLLQAVAYLPTVDVPGAPARVYINYPLMELNIIVDDVPMDMEDYLELIDGEWHLRSDWAGYEFINQLKF